MHEAWWIASVLGIFIAILSASRLSLRLFEGDLIGLQNDFVAFYDSIFDLIRKALALVLRIEIPSYAIDVLVVYFILMGMCWRFVAAVRDYHGSTEVAVYMSADASRDPSHSDLMSPISDESLIRSLLRRILLQPLVTGYVFRLKRDLRKRIGSLQENARSMREERERLVKEALVLEREALEEADEAKRARASGLGREIYDLGYYQLYEHQVSDLKGASIIVGEAILSFWAVPIGVMIFLAGSAFL